MRSSEAVSYDVFLSFTEPDLERVVQFRDKLVGRELSVFVDRTDISVSGGVTQRIEMALNASRAFVAYYSPRYATRHACQVELSQVFIADAAEDDAESRIIVINPAPDKRHIEPVELRDRIYLHDDGSAEQLDVLADRIATYVAQLNGTFRDIRFEPPPRPYGQRTAPPGLVPRYTAMWRLHSALQRRHYRMTNRPSDFTTVLAGLSGSGKTTLVDDYVRYFGYAYPPGAYRLDLRHAAGLDAKSVVDALAVAIKKVCGLDESLSPLGTLRAAYEMLVAERGHVLWVVDHVPPELPPDALRALSFDLSHVHTVLVTERRPTQYAGEYVELGGLDADEGLELFRRYHAPHDSEVGAVRAVVERLGGHVMAIEQAALAAKERSGLTTLGEHLARILEGSSDTLARVTSLVATRLSTLDEAQLNVLRLAAVCAPDPLPVRFVRDVLAAVGIPEDVLLDALRALEHALLLHSDGDLRVVHPLVRDATLGHHRDMAALVALVPAATECIIKQDWAGRLASPADQEWRYLVRHARQLLHRRELTEPQRERLLRLIAQYHVEANELAAAARALDELLLSCPDDTEITLLTARCHDEIGEHDEAVQLARRVIGADPGPRLHTSAIVVLASALDALGLLAEAEPLWRDVASGILDELPPGERPDAQLRLIRSRRLRGQLRSARTAVDALLSETDELPIRVVHRALLERAYIQLDTDQQPEARETAGRVAAHYEVHGTTHDPLAQEARYLQAYAAAVLHVAELRSVSQRWAAAEQQLRALVADQGPVLGFRNITVLTSRVAIGQMLIFQGKAREARQYAHELLMELVDWVDAVHPLRLRTQFVLGLAHQQLAAFEPAVRRLESSHRGQLAVLGVHHPETLRTQFELGMALKLAGHDNRRANELLDGVRAASPNVTGRLNDLYLQAVTGSTIARHAPRWILLKAHKANHSHKWSEAPGT